MSGWSGMAYSALRRVIGFINAGVIWGAIITLGWIFVGETTRVWVRRMMGEKPTTIVSNGEKQFPLLETEAYHDLSIAWKQVLAEVQVNQSKYPPRFVSILRELTLSDISTLDHIAPYVMDNAIIHAAGLDVGYDIPSVTDLDFERLKSIGILTSPRFGAMTRNAVPNDGRPAQTVFKGTTLALIVRATNATKTFDIHLTPLTEEGARMVNLLRKPTDLKGLCMIAAQIKENKEIQTVIHTTFALESSGSGWSDPNAIVNVTGICSKFGVDRVN